MSFDEYTALVGGRGGLNGEETSPDKSPLWGYLEPTTKGLMIKDFEIARNY